MNILIAILIFSAIIIIHELGHFLVAKWNHVRVYEFSLGLGPKLVGFKRGETEYSLNLLPFGGACVMGEDDQFDQKDEKLFNNKSVWVRMAVVFAGPFFNFILAFVLALIVIGVAGYDLPTIRQVQEGSPAAEAGLKDGDLIKRLNGRKVALSREVSLDMMLAPQEPLEITYERQEGKETVTGTAVVTPELIKRYRIGITYTQQEITEVEKDSPADGAGLLPGDQIMAINGKTIEDPNEISEIINSEGDKPLTITLERKGERLERNMNTIKTSSYENGLYLDSSYRTRESVFSVVKYSLYEVKYWIVTTFKSLGMLFSGNVSLNDLSGPVGIVDTIGNTYEQTREAGWLSVVLTMLNLSILLTANLGVMNLLPIPALDGGRLLFLVIEAIRGKRISPQKEGLVHMIGYVLLLGLMVVVMVNDVRKIFF